jgi:hypothetical protein
METRDLSMKAQVINDDGELNFECKDMKFEGGFVVFEKEGNEEVFCSVSRIMLMNITGRPKKAVKKEKKNTEG